MAADNTGKKTAKEEECTLAESESKTDTKN